MTWTRPARGGSSDRMAVPILPPSCTSWPAAPKRWATSAVVVDVPLVPVMATNPAWPAWRRRPPGSEHRRGDLAQIGLRQVAGRKPGARRRDRALDVVVAGQHLRAAGGERAAARP